MSEAMTKTTAPPRKKTVLIVEDSEDFSNLLKFVIEDEGFEALQFPVSGDDIVAWVKEHSVDAILMDLALRRKSGMEYIHDLKADLETGLIPVIIVSGRDLSQKEIVGLQNLGVKYLRKGRVEMEEIKEEVRKALHAGAARPPRKITS